MAANWTSTLIPTDDKLIPDLPGEHRNFKEMVRAVLIKEHATLSGDNLGCEHKQGSAVAWYLATGSIPALDVEGNALAATDNGRMWLDSTTKIFYALDDYSDPTVGGGWVAMGHLLGDIAINTNKFTVARATGNTAIAGTLDVTGATEVTGVATVGDGSLTKTSAAPTTDAMLANKKYVNDEDTANVPVGAAPTANDSTPTAMLKAHVYKAQTAGFVNAYVVYTGTLQIYVSSIDAGAAGGSKIADVSTAVGSGYNTGTVFVPKDYYFDVASGGTPTIYWTPLIAGGGAPVDQD